ncbi:MAG: HAMP domain-containing protein [Planctomycetia bacterium]|nr:HAMP domain-containing protein [Planctomycetia bacterium]
MMSIRTKFIFFMSMLVIMIGLLSCLFFLIHSKRQQEEVLKRFGTSLVMLLAQDNEVKHALSSAQPAFLDAPIHKVRELDREEEIGYLRISNSQAVMVEEKAPWINIDLKGIPFKINYQESTGTLSRDMWTRGGRHAMDKPFQYQDKPLVSCIKPIPGEVFCDFLLPIFEKQTFSEEEFAAQILGEDRVTKEDVQPILGFVQVGLSHHKLNERIHKIIWQSIIPMGLFIVFGWICITFFLTRYIISPLQYMASITLDIAKGNFTRTVDIHSKDEIGQLSMNFNQMTQSLRGLSDEKEKIMAQLREHIHDLCHANQELKKAQERLIRSEKLAVVGKLASGVGHELRNPLGAIRNALFVIKKKTSDTGVLKDNQKLHQLIEIVERETERSIKIVNDLLGFSRTSKPAVSPTHINSIIESSLSRLKIPEKIKTVVQGEESLPLVLVDQSQIEQVFINLIQNACDAMPLGGLLTIRTCKEDPLFLTIAFTDTGCGIPDNIKNFIFDPLFTTKSRGLGLGLAVSSSIILRHGGCIDLKSKEGAGSTFIVKLPIGNI